MSYVDWKVGDRVVYVNESGRVRTAPGRWLGNPIMTFFTKKLLHHNLVRDEVYTIEAIVTHTDFDTFEEVVCIFLHGFRFRENAGVAFPARWFRRVQSRKTDISIFTAILNGSKVQETA